MQNQPKLYANLSFLEGRHSLKIENNEEAIISRDLYVKIVCLLNNVPRTSIYFHSTPAYPSHYLGNGGGIPEFIWSYQTSRGSLPKRLNSFFRKYNNVKIPKEILTKIGALIVKERLNTQQYFIDIRRGPFNWAEYKYGHGGGSCWWSGGFFSYKSWFSRLGGFAVLWHLDEKRKRDYARCWAYQLTKESFVIFNSYSNDQELPLVSMAAILSNFLGVKNKECYLKSRGFLSINSRKGYIIGEEKDFEYLRNLCDYYRDDLEMIEIP